jgi:molybdate transport system ATP-binding protein
MEVFMELSVDIKKKLPGFSLDINLKAGKEVLGLLGASGSGKSMTLRCIAGIETPDTGRIVLNGRVLFDSEKGINLPSRKRKVGLLFQNYAMFPHMTVEENIRFGLSDLKLQEQKKKVEQMIALMQLNGLEKRYPAQLSGGQKQRAALARTLAVEPEALLLDEPFSALDDYLRNQMVKSLIETLSDYRGVTLFVTHNMEEAYRICSDLVILSNGNASESGDKNSVFKAPQTLAAAQLTGCKNISTAVKISDHILEAMQWGCKLKFNSELPDITHVGIRAHHISISDETAEENVFPCWPSYISETPFRIMVYLMIGKKPSGAKEYQIQWEISRENWDEMKNKPVPWKLCLKPENLILINENYKKGAFE